MNKKWVQIEDIILKSENRADSVPNDTKKCPYIMRINGYLLTKNAKINDIVEIETLAKRKIKGKLIEFEPAYTHSFGNAVTELINIGINVRNELKNKENSNER